MHRLLALVLFNAIMTAVTFRSLGAPTSAEQNHGYVINMREWVDDLARFKGVMDHAYQQ